MYMIWFKLKKNSLVCKLCLNLLIKQFDALAYEKMCVTSDNFFISHWVGFISQLTLKTIISYSMFKLIGILLAIALHTVAAINAHSATSNLALSSAHAEKKKIKVEISISSEDDNTSSNEDPVTPEPPIIDECIFPINKVWSVEFDYVS